MLLGAVASFSRTLARDQHVAGPVTDADGDGGNAPRRADGRLAIRDSIRYCHGCSRLPGRQPGLL